MAEKQAQSHQRLRTVLMGMALAVVAVTVGTIFMLSQQGGSLAVSQAITGNSRLLQADASQATYPIATVNNIAITNEIVDREINTSRFNIMDPLPPLLGDDLNRARTEALNQLITRQLILQAAIRQGFVVEPVEIAERVRLLYGNQEDERLQSALQKAEITHDDLIWWVSELLTVEEYTIDVVMATAQPEDRQQVYNEWLNAQQAAADIQIFDQSQPAATIALPGNPAPNFSLQTIDGQTVSLADFRGQVVLINFWATWCPSCIAEMPDYEAVYQQQAITDFVVLGVNLQESSDQARKFSEGLGLTFPILLDIDGQTTIRDYQMVGMPGSVLVDQQGTIFYRHIGPMSGALLLEKLNALKSRDL